MAIALIVFSRLASGTKVLTRLRGLSIRTKVRGLFKTGTPGLLFVSTPASLEPPNLESPQLDIFRQFIYTVQGYDKKDKQIKVAHYGVADYMKVAFEKEKIRRVQNIPQVIETAQRLGSGGDMVGWLNRTLTFAAGKPGRTWEDVWGDGSTVRHPKGVNKKLIPDKTFMKKHERRPGDPLVRKYFSM